MAFQILLYLYNVFSKTAGDDHPLTLQALHDIADCYDAMGQHEQAAELRKKLTEQ